MSIANPSARVSDSLGDHWIALPALFLLEAGLFLDWTTTILAEGYAGGREANPFAAPLLRFYMIPWSVLHIVALIGMPYALIRLHNRVPEQQMDLVLKAGLVVGAVLTGVGVNNIIGLFRI